MGVVFVKNKEYWTKRFEQLELAQIDKGVEYYHNLTKQYTKAIASVEKDLAKWYTRYATENGITLTEAKRILNSRELAEFRMDVKEYIKKGESLDPKWAKQLEAASVKFHVSRLEALKVQMQQQAELVCGGQIDDIDALARKIYTDGYYHTAYEIQKGIGVGWDLMALDSNKIDKLISKPWAADGKNFSERIWGNRTQLVNELENTLTQSIIRGQSPKEVISEIAQRFNVSKSRAGTLVMTESAFFASAAQRDCFNDLDVERFEVLATLDSHTSETCRHMDGKVLPMREYKPGITAPPFHARCRSTTVPYFDDEFTEGEQRAAKDAEGKYYTVPAKMKYEEWKEAFVDGGSKEGLILTTANITIDNLHPEQIAGVKAGKPMSFEEANQGNANPNYGTEYGYSINCQTCVVSYEARLRGYDVIALPNTPGSVLEKLSRQTNLAWIDPATGKYPEYIFEQRKYTAKTYKKYLEGIIEKGKRYTIEFVWKGRGLSGHIIHIDRLLDGKLRLYDPQIGRQYIGLEFNQYLTRFKYEVSVQGWKIPYPPKLLRVDDKEFNLEVVNKILKGAK